MPRIAGWSHRFGPLAGLLLAAAVVWSCGGNPTAPGTGSLSVFMAFDNGFPTAPAAGFVAGLGEDHHGWGDRTPLADLIVSFQSVEAWACADWDALRRDDEEEDEEHEDDAAGLGLLHDGDGGDPDDHDPWEDPCESFVVLADSTVTLSVSGLDTTLTGFLGDAELPAGEYDFLVLGMVAAWVVTQAGDTVEAAVPSGRIKVKTPFTLDEGGSTEIVIVFDVNRSVIEAPPGSMRFLVKPVLHSGTGWGHPGRDRDRDDDDEGEGHHHEDDDD